MAPVVPNVAEVAYERLPDAWRERDNDETGHLLLGLVAGLAEGFAEPWDLVEDAAAFLNVDTVAAKWLPLLAAMNGARLQPGMTEAQQRAEIRNPTGWRRGLPASILEAVAPYLPPGVTPRLRERTDPDNPGDQPAHISLQIRTAWVTDEPALLAAFQAVVPIGLFGHLIVTDNRTYDDIADDFTDYDDVAASVTDYDDLLTP